MTSKNLVCGLAFTAVMIAALPAAQGIGASTKDTSNVQVNRAAKGDRIAEPISIAVRKAPEQTQRPPAPTEQSDKRKIMDGCEPSFSPVTVPSMAHIAGRCVG